MKIEKLCGFATLSFLFGACGTATPAAEGTAPPADARVADVAPSPGDAVVATDAGSTPVPDAATAHAPAPVVIGGVPVRLDPSTVRLEADANADGWTVFDRDPAHGLATAGRAVRLRLDFTAPVAFEALAVHGASRGTLTVLRDEGGGAVAIDGLVGVSLRDPGSAWRRIRASSPIAVSTLFVDWAPDDASATLPHLELWGRAERVAVRPGMPLADQVLAGAAHPTREVSSAPDEVSVSAHAPDAGLVHLHLDAGSSAWTRAFLVYEVTGLSHWTSVPRSINGGAVLGGHHVVQRAQGGVQAEEIPVLALRPGDNEIRFTTVDPVDALGYHLRNIHLVGFAGVQPVTTQTSDDGQLRALGDGDPHTVLEAHHSDGPLSFHFDRAIDPAEIAFRTESAASGVLEVSTRSDGHHRSLSVDLHGMAPGWHHVPLDGVLPASDTVSIHVRAAHESAGSVSEVVISGSPSGEDPQPEIVLTYPLHGECVESTGYVRGYLRVPADALGAAVVTAPDHGSGRQTVERDGAFALTVQPPGGADATGDVVLRADYPGGVTVTRSVRLEHCGAVREDPAEQAEGAPIVDPDAPFGVTLRAGEARTVAFGDARLEIPADAVEHDVRLTIRPLAANQLPPLDRGMTNVMPTGTAFRLGPHHLRFRRPIRMTLPFDPTRLPSGFTVSDVRTYYYDEAGHRWRSLPRSAGSPGLIASATDHFTDFMTATMPSPDHPSGASFNPNAMRDLQAPSPAAGITEIQPPTANSSGSAATSFPIEVPPGRNGIQPSLQVVYNSEHANGWMGVGWDLQLSSIEIDTRFGVPLYDGTETYLLDGAALTVPSGAPISGDPVTFVRRVEGAYDRIVRHGTSPQSYWWEVTNKSGVVFTYGSPDGTEAAGTEPMVRLGAGHNIFRWNLRYITDLFGNRLTVTYWHDDGTLPGAIGSAGPPFTQTYPSVIDYTSNINSGLSGDTGYSVKFTWGANLNDAISNARAGFDVRTRQLLNRVDVMYGPESIRSYHFDYVEGAFGKNLLASIAMRGAGDANELYRHTFSYYGMNRNTSDEIAFSDPVPWGNIPTAGGGFTSMASNSADTLGSTVSGSAGIGPPLVEPCDPVLGVTLSGGYRHTNAARAVLDVNGDGLADLLRSTDPTHLRINTHRTPPGLAGQFDPAMLYGIGDIADPGSLHSAWQADLALSVGMQEDGVVSFTGDYTWNWNHTERMLSDANGDGLVDILNIGSSGGIDVFLNPYTPGQTANEFGATDPLTGNIVANYSLGNFAPPTTTIQVDASSASTIRSSMMHTTPVIQWTSRWGGPALITGTVQRLGTAPDGADGVQAFVYQDSGADGVGPGRSEHLLWSHTVMPGDPPCTPAAGGGCGGSGLPVVLAHGDRIYFVVTGLNDPIGDDTVWAPTITYTDGFTGYCVSQDDCEAVPPATTYPFDRTVDFRLADGQVEGWTAPVNGTATIQGGVSVSSSAPVGTTLDQLATFVSVIRYRTTVDSSGVGATPPVPMPPDAGPDGAVDPDAAVGPGAAEINALLHPSTLSTVDVLFTHNFAVGETTASVDLPPLTVQQGDVYVFHIEAKNDPATLTQVDPYFIQWFPLVRYSNVCIATATGTTGCYDVGTCVTDPTDPNTPPVSMCPLLGSAPASPPGAPPFSLNEGLLQQNAQIAVGQTMVPSAWTAPYRAFRGGYHGWRVGEWLGNTTAFSETVMLTLQSDPNAVAAIVDTFAQLGIYTPPPGLSPMSPQPAAAMCLHHVRGGCPDAWVGVGYDSYVTANSLRPSTLGGWTVDPSNNLVPTSETTRSSALAPGLQESNGNGPGVTAGAGTAAGATDENSFGTEDFFDFDGDGLADSVRSATLAPSTTPGQIQFRDRFGHGFHDAVPLNMTFGNVQHTHNTSSHLGFTTGSVAAMVAANTGAGAFADLLCMLPSYVQTNGDSRVVVRFADMNGDGLPDHVESTNGGQDPTFAAFNYQLNVGTDLSAPAVVSTPAAAGDISDVQTTSNSLQWSYHWIGGGPAWQNRQTNIDLMDVNGDGLVDHVSRFSAGPLVVQINRGDHFGPVEYWSMSPWPGGLEPAQDALTAADGVSFAVGGGFVGGIPLPFLCISLAINAGGSGGNDYERLFWTDIDGDGFIDQVLHASESVTVYARLNPSGQANLLQTIHRPLGSDITLNYTRQGNAIDASAGTPGGMPRSRWVLSNTSITDGRGATYATQYAYGNGYYDRAEREFYGFDSVTTTNADHSTITTQYENHDYYQRGLADSTSVADASGSVFRATQMSYRTPSPDILLQHAGQSTPAGSWFPARLNEVHSTWEVSATGTGLDGPVTTTTTYDYDFNDFGNVKNVHDGGDDGIADGIFYAIEYYEDLTHHVFHANHLTATGPTGALLRERRAGFNANGSLAWTLDTLAGGTNPSTGLAYAGTSSTCTVGTASDNPCTFFDYDAYGNLWHYTDASGFVLTYAYDAMHEYRTGITDSFGLRASYFPDPRFGIDVLTTDVHGQHEQLTLDEFGRITQVFGPNEVGGSVPTIQYDYDPRLTTGTATVTPLSGALPVNLVTSELDTGHAGDPITSVTFIDGLHRTVETKHDAEIDAGGTSGVTAASTIVGMTVSGSLAFDLMGRVTRRGDPTFVAGSGSPSTFVYAEEVNPTITVYDGLSRPIQVRTPDGATTTTVFGIQSLDGMPRSATAVTNALGYTGTTFHDVRGQTLAVQLQNTIGGTLQTLTTRYAYDPLGELLRVVDAAADHNVTSTSYDTLGHRIALRSRDMGTTTYEYDLGGNLVARQTANLAPDNYIRYQYDWHRPREIDYPTSPSVTFVYGPASVDPVDNQRGRLIQRNDASGSENFTYGNMGEIVQSVRTLVDFTGATPLLTATTRFAYDSLNRLQTLTYPSPDPAAPLGGEVLTYTYDAGGQVNSAIGRVTYVTSLTYDQFGHRARIHLGSGAETRYAYDPVMHRLQELDADASGARPMQRAAYSYDYLGNILSVVDEPPNAGLAHVPGQTVYQIFGYDQLNQLVAASGVDVLSPGGSPNSVRGYTLTMAYDAIGNITSNNQTDGVGNDPASLDTIVPGTTHSLTYAYGTRPHAPTTVGARTFSYDADGNQTGWIAGTAERTLTWDEEDRLTSISDASGEIMRSLYNAQGERTLRREGDADLSAYVNQFYTVHNPDAVGGGLPSQHVFVGDTRIETSMPDSSSPGSYAQFFYHSDQVSSTQWVTDGTGEPMEHNEYFPFGETWIDQSGGSDVPYLFTGKELDQSGLYYFGARYYDPQQAQWVSPDPALEDNSASSATGGVFFPGNLGAYTYALNRPLVITDPDGREWHFNVPRPDEWFYGFLGFGGGFLGLPPGSPPGPHQGAAFRAGYVVGAGYGVVRSLGNPLAGGGPTATGGAAALVREAVQALPLATVAVALNGPRAAGVVQVAQATNGGDSPSTPASPASAAPPRRPLTAGELGVRQCTVDAVGILSEGGGQPIQITPRAQGMQLGTVRPPAGGIVTRWWEHWAIKRGDRFYDAMTGPAGMAEAAYRRLFDYADHLDFTPRSEADLRAAAARDGAQ